MLGMYASVACVQCGATFKRSQTNQVRALLFGSVGVLVFFLLKSNVSWWVLIPVLLACVVLVDWVSLEFDLVTPPMKKSDG